MALRDYLDYRRAALEAEIKVLQAELAEIRAAEAAISGLDGGAPVVAVRRQRQNQTVREGSIKAWILKVLDQYELDGGLVTDDVIRAVEVMGGPEVPRNSMTPQLSRLKKGGLIMQQGRKWRLMIPLTGLPPASALTARQLDVFGDQDDSAPQLSEAEEKARRELFT